MTFLNEKERVFVSEDDKKKFEEKHQEAMQAEMANSAMNTEQTKEFDSKMTESVNEAIEIKIPEDAQIISSKYIKKSTAALITLALVIFTGFVFFVFGVSLGGLYTTFDMDMREISKKDYVFTTDYDNDSRQDTPKTTVSKSKDLGAAPLRPENSSFASYYEECQTNDDCDTNSGLKCSSKSKCMCDHEANQYWSNGEETCMRCNTEWKAYGNICWRYFDSGLSWTDAKYKCSKHSAELMNIEDKEKFEYVSKEYKIVSNTNGKTKSAWLGAFAYKPREFKWIATANRVCDSFWSSQNPDNNGGNDNLLKEGCLSISKLNDNMFNDEECSLKYDFICEKY